MAGVHSPGGVFGGAGNTEGDRASYGASQLEDTLEARCREELGAEVTIRIELEETAEGVQVHSLTVTQTGEAEETRDAVEELLQHTLGVSPVWDVPGGENAP